MKFNDYADFDLKLLESEIITGLDEYYHQNDVKTSAPHRSFIVNKVISLVQKDAKARRLLAAAQKKTSWSSAISFAERVTDLYAKEMKNSTGRELPPDELETFHDQTMASINNEFKNLQNNISNPSKEKSSFTAKDVLIAVCNSLSNLTGKILQIAKDMKDPDAVDQVTEDAAGVGKVVPGVNTTCDIKPGTLNKNLNKYFGQAGVDVTGKPRKKS